MHFPVQFEADDAEAWHALGMTLAALGDRPGAFTALRCFESATAGGDFNYDPPQ
jgi:hypothetical protein